MAETAITTVLSKLGEFATKEAGLLLQVGDDIMLLRDRLEWLQAFIRDADRKRRVGADDLTRVWVRQTRDVAFEAEDALDDFFHKVELANQYHRGWKILGYLTGFRTKITVRHGLSARINRIKSRLDQISENQKEYKIDHSPSGIWTSSTTALAPWDDLKKVVGREEDATTVCELLFHANHLQKMFISILGESGVGKRTLMYKIRDDNEVNSFFDVIVWYSMPPDSSLDDLLEEVYKIAYKSIHKHNGDPQVKVIDIVEELRCLLTPKRYLVVLDGISSTTILNCVQASLPENNKGSRVVLILEPECEEVARHARTLNEESKECKIESIQRLSLLDEHTSGKLFCSRVFDGDSKKTYEKEVFYLTKGHPLAIVVLAGLLRYKEEPIEWDAVLQELRPGPGMEDDQDNPIRGLLLLKEKPDEWQALQQQMIAAREIKLSNRMEKAQDGQDNPIAAGLLLLQQQMTPARETKLSNRMVIERILSASFDDLPQDLKSCFLYLAAYPMNLSLSAGYIVRMWTAEGFIKPRKGMTLEEVGHSYLKELVSRCLVQWESKNDHGGIETVIVHSRLVRFLQSEAREASFIEVHDRNDILAPGSVRRLSIQDDSGTYTTSSNKFPKLRSFICRVEGGESQSSGKCDENPLVFRCGARLACVVSSPVRQGGGGGSILKNTSSSHDLKFLRGSKFLRLISVQGLRLQELPHEIGEMIHLRYLRVDCPHLNNLPPSIRRLLNLQTLDISNTNVEEIDEDFWKIKTLRHVLAEKLKLPSSLKNKIELPELQTLHGVIMPPSEEKRDQESSLLDKMTKLLSLELYGFSDADHRSALEGAISKMHLLGHLKLKGDAIPSSLFTGPNLRRLQTLELDGPVTWSEVSWDDVRMARPNLLRLDLTNTGNVPKKFTDKMVAHKLICVVDGKPLRPKKSKGQNGSTQAADSAV